MISRTAAGLFFGLPLAIFLWIGTAPAQDASSTVAKTPPAPSPPTTPQGLTEPEDAPGPLPGDRDRSDQSPVPFR